MVSMRLGKKGVFPGTPAFLHTSDSPLWITMGNAKDLWERHEGTVNPCS